MPSRKKAQGKARKVAKATKKEAEEGALEEAMSSFLAGVEQMLMGIGNDESNNNLLLSNCTHGFGTMDERIKDFIREYVSEYQNRQLLHSNEAVKAFAVNQCRQRGLMNDNTRYIVVPISGEAFLAAEESTKVKYYDIWLDIEKMKAVQSFFLARGAQFILDDEIMHAGTIASLACYVEQYIAAVLKSDQATMDAAKTFELSVADKHTLVKFYKKRIPCSCLDDIYKEVKSITKMGLCCSRHCRQPRVERKTMLNCTRCRNANYCSRECQVADWPEHRIECDIWKAGLDSKQRS